VLFLDFLFFLKLQSGKLGIKVACHLEFNGSDFSIVFTVDLKGSLEMIKDVTTVKIDTKLKIGITEVSRI
jgi:hypothetical protein